MPGKHPREKSMGKEKRKASGALKVKSHVHGPAEGGPLGRLRSARCFLRGREADVALGGYVKPLACSMCFSLYFLSSLFFPPIFSLALGSLSAFIILPKARRKIFNGLKAA